MNIVKVRNGLAVLITLLGVTPAAHAQWAVIDVGAITQLVQEVTTMKQQLDTARNELTQAQQAFQSMTGGRGMERLLSGTVRNYLPADWAQLQSAVQQASSTYSALAADVQAIVNANAILTQQQVAALSPDERDQLNSSRRSAAMLQATATQALSNASSRFAAIQQLIDAIPSAQDQKGILDLQARISAEQGMLANEHTKLDVLYQATQAQELARKQRAREQVVASVGSLRSLPAMGL